jgi:WD40 repeat protein
MTNISAATTPIGQAPAPPEPAPPLVARLLLDQRRRWLQGERVLVEAYLEQYPALDGNIEALLDLIHNEVILREGNGEIPQLAGYQARFPVLASQLAFQFELDQLIQSHHRQQSTPRDGSSLGKSSSLRGEREMPSVPGYEILELLGRGGMGVVYKARHTRLDRVVALKMLLAGTHAGSTELARLRREAEAAAHLQHPHIVQIYEVGEWCTEHGGPLMPYLALEFVDGPSLKDELGGTPWPAQRAAALVETLGQAIHLAHQRGVIHRDLKPANVLLTADGTPKIADFSLAKRLEVGPEVSAANLTQSDAIVGTPSYMAPEQASGKSRHIGPLVDIYALGAILYEALTGRPPFQGANVLDTLEQVRNQEPIPPSRFQPKLPRDLETICLKCLEKEPHKRYTDASALAEDLRRFRVGKPVRARPVRTWERCVKWARRRPAIAALLASVVFVTALGFGLVTWQWLRAETAGQALADKAGELEVRNYFKNLALAERELSVNNVGRAEEILDTCPERLRGWEWHCLKRLRYGHFPAFQQHAAAAYGPVFSPDGRYLASGARDGTVKISEVTTGREILTFKRPGHDIYSVAYSADGQRLATGDKDGLIVVWSTTTGEMLQKLEGHKATVGSVLFSPDGNWIASGYWDQTVKLWDAATGSEIYTFKGYKGAAGVVGFLPGGRDLVTRSAGGTVIVWNTTTGREISSFRDQVERLQCGALSHDGGRLALGGQDGLVTICDLATGQKILTLPGHTLTVAGLAFSHDGRRLVSGGYDKTLKVWDTTTGQETLTLHGHSDTVNGLAFSPSGEHLASASRDGAVNLWDARPLPATEKEPQALTLRGHNDRVLGVTFSPDGLRLASASWDGTVKLWDAHTGKETLTFCEHTDYVWAVAFSPDGRRVASTGWDSQVRLWDPTTGRQTHAPLFGGGGPILSVAFRPDGRQLAATMATGKVKVWDPATAQVHTLAAHNGSRAQSVAFSPDGRRLVSASWDGELKIWDTTTWNLLHTLPGYRSTVRCVAISPDSRRLASASEDGTVKIWQMETGEEILNLQHPDRVFSVALAPMAGAWPRAAGIKS